MINEVNRLLGDGVAPAIETEYFVGERDGPVTLQVSGVRSSTNRPLADEVRSQPGVQSLLNGLLLLAGVLRASKPLHSGHFPSANPVKVDLQEKEKGLSH